MELDVSIVIKKDMIKNNYPMWKRVIEEEEKNSKPKVGINVTMVEWDQSIFDVCVTMQGLKVSMPVKEPP
jgi:hypothetical protein